MHTSIEKILELCRLCQVTPGTIKIIDNNKFINQVFECTKIKINTERMDLLPKTVCSSCKLNIEEFFAYVQDIRIVDQRLQEQLLKCEDLKADVHYNTNCSTDLSTNLVVKEVKEVPFKRRFKCPICPKTYARFKNLQCHKKCHSSLYCACCKTMFDDTASQRNHTCNSLNEVASNEKSNSFEINSAIACKTLIECEGAAATLQHLQNVLNNLLKRNY